MDLTVSFYIHGLWIHSNAYKDMQYIKLVQPKAVSFNDYMTRGKENWNVPNKIKMTSTQAVWRNQQLVCIMLVDDKDS